MIPIDEQITAAKDAVNAYRRLKNHGRIAGDDAKLHKFGDVCSPQAILASFEELKRIREVQVPDEPTMLSAMRLVGNAPEVIKHIDTLRDLLRRETYLHQLDHSLADQWLKRADAAESKLANVEDALSTMTPNHEGTPAERVLDMNAMLNEAWRELAAMKELGAEPSEGMIEAGRVADRPAGASYRQLFTAMFNKMMEELK
jgi:hypothetical protein